MKEYLNTDKNKYCTFHEGRGHDTDKCIQLKDVIEQLVRAGRLGQYVKRIGDDESEKKKKHRDRPPSSDDKGSHRRRKSKSPRKEKDHHVDRRERSPAPRKGPNEETPQIQINTIARGFAGGSPTSMPGRDIWKTLCL
ncbi:hypothetical protein SESBI_06962 [Sesbania bispinosa]|nr:hypothetical protein SESBI_06962 [Sesbania bispinosa]